MNIESFVEIYLDKNVDEKFSLMKFEESIKNKTTAEIPILE